MGLSMIGFPATYGGHSTLMAPTAFVRRPQRWIRALSDASREGRVVTAAPNFAYEWAAQRGTPVPGEDEDDIDLANVVAIIGSEPVSMAAIDAFNAAFGPHGLPPTAMKPSYGIAEATLFIANIPPDQRATATWFDADLLAAGRAVAVAPDAPNAVAHVSCGVVARSLRALVVDSDTGEELPDGSVGEFWLHGDNVARGYWRRPEETRLTFAAHLRSRLPVGSRADGVDAGADWLRTGDLGMFVDGQLYVTGRIVDLLRIDGRTFYPQDIESTVADASALVRRGYLAAFTAPGPDDSETLVVIAERATGTARSDMDSAITDIRRAVSARHGLTPSDIRILPAGAIPRTTSGKLARRACRGEYLAGSLKGHRR
jgi:fatty-acyl-CoA synthase